MYLDINDTAINALETTAFFQLEQLWMYSTPIFYISTISLSHLAYFGLGGSDISYL